MKIFMIVIDKCPNTTTGVMGGVPRLVGESYLIPTHGLLKLLSIEEGIGRNKKPVVVEVFEKEVTIEYPDYNIDKFRYYGQDRPKTDDKSKGHK